MLTLSGLVGAVGLVGAIVTMASGGPVWDDWILDDRGVQARATVVSRQAVNVRHRAPDDFELSWRARDASGRALEGMARGGAAVGDQVTVDYDPERPARSRLVGRSAMRSPVLTHVQLGLAALGLPLLALLIARVRRRKALYRDGTAARATVVSSERTWMRSDGDPVHRVTVRYASARGEHAVTLTPPDAPAPGEGVWVIHDPRRPERALLA